MSRLTTHLRTLTTKTRPKVSLPQGIYIGTLLPKTNPQNPLPHPIEQFLGIPYASPQTPRFAPPIPLDRKCFEPKREFDASVYGPRCPVGWGDANYAEDCLSVNIFRPEGKEEELLPVVVFFHGGAFNSGFGHGRDIASFVAWSAERIMGVSFNYRLGAFGFLPLRLRLPVGGGGEGEGVLNVGLRDQVEVLRWVRGNIKYFGGDKEKVTVMGCSAGAHSLGHLLLMDLDDDGGGELFQRVIMESGAATARACYPFDRPLHKRQLEEFLASLEISNALEPKEVVQKLREKDMESIKQASDALFGKYNPSLQWPFQPVIDGPKGMIPHPPITSLTRKAAKTKTIPILTGFNTNEGATFIPPSLSTSSEFTHFFRTLLPAFTEADLSTLNALYPDPLVYPESKYIETRKGLGAEFKRAEQAYGHFAYVAPVRQTASLSHGPIYLYHFAPSMNRNNGAEHGAQSPFVVYSKELRMFSETINEISGSMHAYWSSFVATGSPNGVRKGRFADRPVWNRFCGDEDGEVMVFGEGNDEVAGGREKGVAVRGARDEWAREECRFWWRMKEEGKC